MSSELDEAIGRARSGDREAFAVLYRAYAGPLLSFLAKRVRRRDDAEDLLAQTFLEAMRDIARFDGDAAGFRAWLFRIAHLRAIDLARQIERRPEDDLEAAGDRPGPLGTDEQALAALERSRLWDAVQRLPEEQRRVLVLRLGSGLTSAEIGAVLGKRTGAVKALQHRALANLARDLGVPRAAPEALQE